MIVGLIYLMIIIGVCLGGYIIGGSVGLALSIVICLLLMGGGKNGDDELIKLIEAMDGGDENARKNLAGIVL